MKKLTTEEFIKKAKAVHGNKYDYSLVDYKDNKTKVKIICPEHGIFWQLTSNHLRGRGCSKCNVNKHKLITGEFIKKASKIHNNRYDYSLVDYINNSTKIKIICPEHGIFEQTPNNHYTHGCFKCSTTYKLTTKEFIKKAKLKHNNKYNYSLIDYEDSKTKVKIICPEHGIFEQQPYAHLNGQGCKICSGKYKYSNSEFIKKVKLKHNNKYDYSLTNYINNKTKIKIICPKHGLFEQNPKSHLQGKGCFKCNESKGEKAVAKYLDNKNIQYVRQYKFNDCKNIKPLPFDFYLSEINILVEYDGEQHFVIKEIWDGKKGLKYRQQNDAIKNKYCKDNNIQLVRIKYNENIEEKLSEVLA